MQMVTDEEGMPAPRLIDYEMTLVQAREFHQIIMREVVRMLCAGYVHGDLSEFNILIAKDGPVIIDLPQAVQATSNTASGILERDLNHLARFFGRVAPEIAQTQYAKEIWALFQSGKLKPDSPLTGTFKTAYHRVNVRGVLAEIEDAEKEERLKRGLK
jgi:RIO kinase 1